MGHHWPNGPHEAEDVIPRMAARTPDTMHRIKALGNAVVPQVVYPLFVELRRFLEETPCA